MDLLIIAVLGTLAIAAASQLSDRIGVAPALILLAGGTAVGFLPFIPAIELDPQVVLEGILPPLLFSTAVSISTINFRRELAPVAVLAILLVPLSAAVIGAVLTLLIPGLSLAWAIAMGAILSPTDAVAISIARRLGVSQRIITVLEGAGRANGPACGEPSRSVCMQNKPSKAARELHKATKRARKARKQIELDLARWARWQLIRYFMWALVFCLGGFISLAILSGWWRWIFHTA